MMENMERKLMETYVKGRVRLLKAAEQFFDEEKGASHLVEIIVVIVIVIAIAGVFSDRLKDVVGSIFDNLDGFISGSSHNSVNP